MSAEIKVPTLGESVSSATIARWLKQPGESVSADEPVVELETDKVSVEVASPEAGVLGPHEVEEGAEVEVGALLSVVEAGTGTAPKPSRPCPASTLRHPQLRPPPRPRPAASRSRSRPRDRWRVLRRRPPTSPERPCAAAGGPEDDDRAGRQRPGDRRRHRQGRTRHQGRRAWRSWSVRRRRRPSPLRPRRRPAPTIRARSGSA